MVRPSLRVIPGTLDSATNQWLEEFHHTWNLRPTSEPWYELRGASPERLAGVFATADRDLTGIPEGRQLRDLDDYFNRLASIEGMDREAAERVAKIIR